MPDQHASLITPPNQPDLLPEQLPDGSALFDEKESVGEYTGERFFQKRPVEYKLVVRLLASGVGILTTAAILRVSPSTVIAVRNREGVPIKAEKANLSRLAHVFSNLTIEAACELLTEILADPERRGEATFKDVSDLVKAASLSINAGQLLAGEATARVEIPDAKKPAHEDFNAELAKLRDVTPTGLGVEKNGALREGAESGAAPAPAAHLVPDPAQPGVGADLQVPNAAIERTKAGEAAAAAPRPAPAGECPDARTNLPAEGQSIVFPVKTP